MILYEQITPRIVSSVKELPTAQINRAANSLKDFIRSAPPWVHLLVDLCESAMKKKKRFTHKKNSFTPLKKKNRFQCLDYIKIS